MTRYLMVSMIALVVVSGCRDLQKRHPTESALAVPTEAVLSVEADAATVSTVCVAYGAQLDLAQSALEQNADDASAQEEVAALETIIADACH